MRKDSDDGNDSDETVDHIADDSILIPDTPPSKDYVDDPEIAAALTGTVRDSAPDVQVLLLAQGQANDMMTKRNVRRSLRLRLSSDTDEEDPNASPSLLHIMPRDPHPKQQPAPKPRKSGGALLKMLLGEDSQQVECVNHHDEPLDCLAADSALDEPDSLLMAVGQPMSPMNIAPHRLRKRAEEVNELDLPYYSAHADKRPRSDASFVAAEIEPLASPADILSSLASNQSPIESRAQNQSCSSFPPVIENSPIEPLSILQPEIKADIHRTTDSATEPCGYTSELLSLLSPLLDHLKCVNSVESRLREELAEKDRILEAQQKVIRALELDRLFLRDRLESVSGYNGDLLCMQCKVPI
jgi:hypothetical protein